MSSNFWLFVLLLSYSVGSISKDYAHFYGRMTDASDDGKLLRIHTENKNIKLFRSGDIILFKLTKHRDGNSCRGTVRDTDGNYLVFSVASFTPCSLDGDRLRVGSLMKLESPTLSERVSDARVYRDVLYKRKDDFLEQLNEVNQWLWSFKQQKLKETAKYDEEIEQVKLEKFRALSNLNIKRKDYLHLQRELKFRLDELDRDIEFYRIQNTKVMRDRWAMDRDLGIETVLPYKKVEE